ncbi:MAG: FHA domain-containing protein [Bacteroides sp.]|nr:FHA domain-containing protein [Bacteroides sp.]
MAADNSVMIIRCIQPQCAKLIKLNRPDVSGIYPVTCPHCGLQKNFKLKGLDSFLSSESSVGEAPCQVDNSGKEPVLLKKDFRPQENYEVDCPHCGAEGMTIISPEAGKKLFVCPRCNGKFVALFHKPTAPMGYQGATKQTVNGKLVMLRKGWFNKDFHLPPGRYVIGRHDQDAMSDIAIKNDNSMSRRSVRLDVELTEKGLTFRLTVLKSTNPVLHNNVALGEGESVMLNFGDSIILGTTRFRFDKDV